MPYLLFNDRWHDLTSRAMTDIDNNKRTSLKREQIKFAYLTTLGCMLFGAFLGAIIMVGFVDPDAIDLNLPRWGILLSEALVVVPLYYVLRKRKMSIVETLRLKPVHGTTVRDTIVLGLGLTIVMDEIDRLIAIVFPLPGDLDSGMNFLLFENSFEAMLVIGGAVIVAPFVEEILFRGFLQRQLEEGYRDITKSILMSSALFMMLHFNPWWALQIYMLGIVLGYLAWRTGSIWPAFTVHLINNGASITFGNLDESVLSWYNMGDHVSPLWLIIAGGLIYFGFKSFIHQNPEPILNNI